MFKGLSGKIKEIRNKSKIRKQKPKGQSMQTNMLNRGREERKRERENISCWDEEEKIIFELVCIYLNINILLTRNQ